jgi:hypothetical protein
MPVPTFKTLLACVLIGVCAAGLWAAYDWFQGQYIRPFSEQTALFAGDVLSLPAELSGPGPIRVVHFWDPACPCNVGNQQHLSELLAHYVPLGIEFYAVQKSGSSRPTAREPRRDQTPRPTARRRTRERQSCRRHLGPQWSTGVLRTLQ